MSEQAEFERAASDRQKVIEDLEARIADLEARLPKHSVPASMLLQLEELEEQLRQTLSEADEEGDQ